MSAVLVPATTRSSGWRALAVLGAALIGGACDRPAAVAGGGSSLAVTADSPWRGDPLGEFELVATSGERTRRSDLLGRPAILDFIFTTCAGPCPVLSANMARLQADLAGTEVRLVSVTVDPEIDDAETLGAYAKRYGADPRRWLFLTGEEAQIQHLMASVHLARERAAPGQAAPGFQVEHATRLVVVDREGVVAGYYPGETEEGRLAALARARFLDRQGP
ncbi:MAG TPA: SCO family protein [Planctomycetota bacterium]|nr:SCO family protein [Planctomycetota bacterium]